MSWCPHTVMILGSVGAGKSTLTRAIGAALETFDAFPAAPATAGARAALSHLFRQGVAALRNRAAGRGAVLDGCIASQLLVVDLDERHGRLS